MQKLLLSFLILGISSFSFAQTSSSGKMTKDNHRYSRFFVGDSVPDTFPKREHYQNRSNYNAEVKKFFLSHDHLLKPVHREAIKEQYENAEIK